MGQEVIIEKDYKEVAILSPKKQTDWAAFRKASKAVHGILKGYSVDEIAPARKKSAWKGFGEWDQ